MVTLQRFSLDEILNCLYNLSDVNSEKEGGIEDDLSWYRKVTTSPVMKGYIYGHLTSHTTQGPPLDVQ